MRDLILKAAGAWLFISGVIIAGAFVFRLAPISRVAPIVFGVMLVVVLVVVGGMWILRGSAEEEDQGDS